MPILFVPNKGQLDGRILYYAKGPGYSFSLGRGGEVAYAFAGGTAKTESGAALAERQGYVLRLKFAGANANAVLSGAQQQEGKINYLVGTDSEQWRTGIPTFAEARYAGLYPGIDLVYKGSGAKIKYEFGVAPGADYRAIRMAYSGAQSLKLSPEGNLLIGTPRGELKDEKPVAYQLIDGKKAPVAAAFVLNEDTVGFALGSYDPRVPVVIDPGLDYSTFIGGTGSTYEQSNAIATKTDSTGAVFITGTTPQTPLPTTDYPTTPGAWDTSHNGQNGATDVFVTKLNKTGSSPLVYSTFLGGSADDEGLGIDVDRGNCVYVTGKTSSNDFSMSVVNPNTFDTTANGSTDAFVAKLDATGSVLLYSTYLGGDQGDEGCGIAVKSGAVNTEAYVVGSSSLGTSIAFPTTGNAFQQTCNGASDPFVAVLNATGTALNYCTLFGGQGCDSGTGIAIDPSGKIYFTGVAEIGSAPPFPTTPGAYDETHNGGGSDAFAAKIDPALFGTASLKYSTFLGGDEGDSGLAIAVDYLQSNGAPNMYVTGMTIDGVVDFPTTSGAVSSQHGGGFGLMRKDAFLAKINPSGLGNADLKYSSFLGGSGQDEGRAIDLDSKYVAYVTGYTSSANYPTSQYAYDLYYNGGDDVFMSKVEADPTLPTPQALRYSTFLGGGSDDWGNGILVQGSSVYVTGFAREGTPAFPTTTGAFKTFCNVQDAFVTKFGALQTAPIPSGYTTAASVSVGENVTVDLGRGISLKFQSVTSPGSVTVTYVSPRYEDPSGYAAIPGGCYEISTTAGFSGTVDVTLPYEEGNLRGNEQGLKLFHRGNGWQDVTLSVNADDDTITGRTSSFSDFEIAEPAGSSVSVPASSAWALLMLTLIGLTAARRRLSMRTRMN